MVDNEFTSNLIIRCLFAGPNVELVFIYCLSYVEVSFYYNLVIFIWFFIIAPFIVTGMCIIKIHFVFLFFFISIRATVIFI